jgi:competence protein ComEC
LPIDSCSSALEVGERILFYGEIAEGRGFVRPGCWSKTTDKASFSFVFAALHLRKQLLTPLKRIIPDPDAYSFAAALMFGYRAEMDKELRQSFANVGAAHILSVSGLHFSIVFGMIYFLLGMLSNSPRGRISKQLIALPLLWGFAFLTGFSPPVIRSVIMISIWGIGSAFFQRAYSINTLSIAAFFMLLFYPLYLFDVGFQLSFLSVASILIFNPYLVKLYQSRNPMINYVWQLNCVSITAQTGILPLVIYYFHQFPLVFMLSNLLLLPLVSVIMFLIPVCLILQGLLGTYAWIAFPVNTALKFFLNIIRSLDHLPYSSLSGLTLSPWGTVSFYLALLLGCLLLIKKRSIYLYLFILLGVCSTFAYLCS